MVRSERRDDPGSWHHVVNRGLARRSIFEEEADYRFFLSRLARVSRRGLLEVHAYCLLANHYHLLVRSPGGELARAMALVQKDHTRRFNRRQGRDGPLFRGRFRSRPIESEAYWFTVLRYIALNPVQAGLVDRAHHYAYGSARWYARTGPRPRWLSRHRVERAIMGGGGTPYDPGRYREAIGPLLTSAEVDIVERRLASPVLRPDPLAEIRAGIPDATSAWLRENACKADGDAGVVVTTADTLQRAVDLRVRTYTLRHSPTLGGRVPISAILSAGLLRTAAGLDLMEIARRLDCSVATVSRRIREHSRILLEDDGYASLAGEILRSAVDEDLPRPSGR